MNDKRIIVVTGGASGIGRASAKRFAEDGDFVVVADVNVDGAMSVVEEIRAADGSATHFGVDVADDDKVKALSREIIEKYGGADVLVTSAGVLQNVTSICNMDIEEHDRVWSINYRGAYLCCREFGQDMVRRRRGCIVNISSTSAFMAFPLHAYGPGKAAISQLTKLLASDFGPYGVRVNAVVPGYVLTEQMQYRIDSGYRDASAMQDQGALGRMVLPSEVADGIYFLASDAARAITGICMPVDAGWLCHVSYTQHPGWPPTDWDADKLDDPG